MFAFAALVIGFIVAGLQLGRVVRGHTLGVARTTWGMVGILSSGWAAFYINMNENWVAVGNLLFTPIAISIAVICSQKKLAAAAAFAAGIAATMLAVFNLPAVVQPVLATVAGFMLFPQLLVVVKASRNLTSLDGVSIWAWSLNTLVAAMWFAQGVVFRSPEMLFANGLLFATAVPIVWITVTQPKRLARAALNK